MSNETTPSEEDPLIMTKGSGEVGGTSGQECGTTSANCYVPKSTFEDHFSLETPSDEIRFRNNSVRVFTSGTQQFQIGKFCSSLVFKSQSGSVVRTMTEVRTTFAMHLCVCTKRYCFVYLERVCVGFFVIGNMDTLS